MGLNIRCSVLFTVMFTILLVIRAEGKHMKQKRRCYHDKWMSHKQSQLKECHGRNNVCSVSAVYSGGTDEQKGCGRRLKGSENSCNSDDCFCDVDGCNKDWLTCLASINKTNDPECISKVSLYPATKCYYDDGDNNVDLIDCGLAENRYRKICRISPYNLADFGQYRLCETIWGGSEMGCSNYHCYCHTDGCNIDWATCLATINKTNDPSCQEAQEEEEE